jgi:acetaldehyde dehydrogenase (acetylating)
VPVFIHRSADAARAAAHVVAGKTFDFGTLCSSEQAVVCDEPLKDAVLQALRAGGVYVLSDTEAAAVARVVVTPQRLANPEIVGRPAPYIAARAGVAVPPETRVLMAPLQGVGREFPLSIEKLSPVLAFYVVRDWQEGVKRCQELLRYGGTGHTAGIHASDEEVIRAFALAQPVSRVIANTQTSMGATGATTALAPSMSLGCGAWAGNMTSDNITPLHLVNVKRLAYPFTRPSRGPAGASAPSPAPSQVPAPSAPGAEEALDFVCEDDVRRALRAGKRLRLAPRAIVTPAARDLAEGQQVLVRTEDA